MLQRVVRQIRGAGYEDNILVMTAASQKELIECQVPEGLTIIAEPQRRETFPAIYLACLALYRNNVPADETIMVLPCDSFATDSYYSELSRIDEIVQEKIADIVLLGITPSYPSTKYGYILPKKTKAFRYKTRPIQKFIEKPDEEEAQKLIDEGALWNGGIYGFQLGYMMKLGYKTFKTLDYATFIADYHNLEKLNFSYEVLEKSSNKVVVPYTGQWKDIGTWNSLSSELAKHQYGLVNASDCRNTYIINELDQPLVCLGCENMIIAMSKEGMLVANRDKCEEIKTMVDEMPSEEG